MSAEPVSPNETYRYDPYRNYRFRVKWDGRYVAGFSKVSALTRTTQASTFREGGNPTTPRSMPGQSEHDAVTLERGVTHDVSFEQWANTVWDYRNSSADEQQGAANGQSMSLADFRKDIVLEVYNEAGQQVMAYTLYRCWPSEFTALPDLDSNGGAVAIQSLKLENEGWERDATPSV